MWEFLRKAITVVVLSTLIACQEKPVQSGHTNLKDLKAKQEAYQLWEKCTNLKPKYGAREVFVRHRGTLIRCRN